MKMRKKIVTAMAIATVLSSTASISHAANTTTGFTVDTGNGVNGQAATQTANIFSTTAQTTTSLTVSGDIEIDGIFNKSITNFPTPDKDGRYLRVTMPITMDYVYNVDTNKMTAAQGLIQNRSVYATKTNTSSPTLEPQPIKMTFEDVELTSKSTAGVPVEFVNRVESSNKNSIQLPFEIRVSGPSLNSVQKINLTDIDSKKVSSTVFDIQKDSNLQLELGLITGEVVGNTELMDKAQTRVNHNLTLKFEYAGK